MKTYDKYKSSGIDSIGDIPEHWEFMSLRRITEEHRQGYYTTKEYLTEGVKLIRITDLDENGNISYETMPFVEISEKDEEIFQVQYGDFLFPRTGSIGLLGLVKSLERAVFASYLINFRFKKHLSPNFLKFYFFSDTFKSGIISDLHGGVNQNIHAENIKNQFIAIPSFPEQTAIADYLDEKTAQIDKLIAEKRRLIELLKEERLGVINQAVTRGINPHAKLKPSGIACLGDIPEYWEIKKLKWVCQIIDCKHTTPNYLEIGIAVVSTGNVKPFEISLDSARKVSLSDFEQLSEGDRKPLKNDIIYSRNASVGAAALVRTDEDFCLGQDICLVRSEENQEFLENVLNCKYVSVQLESVLVGSTFRRINIQQIKEFFIILPPIEEQKQIVEFIESATGKIDATIATIEKEIGFLREYRTALISEVVTGKIKVV